VGRKKGRKNGGKKGGKKREKRDLGGDTDDNLSDTNAVNRRVASVPRMFKILQKKGPWRMTDKNLPMVG
jgi:hypothetical protein